MIRPSSTTVVVLKFQKISSDTTILFYNHSSLPHLSYCTVLYSVEVAKIFTWDDLSIDSFQDEQRSTTKK